ncbi:PREDICTED: protein sidekick-1 [Bison bison bison]|uniref:Protein sidekick-1 n=1 Tax=Bison bison bison TaxID=43346 RepID=A0A6P3HNR6_BISBB|nr:PREDICTED: protein sidekick-1 [Bison bison bison]
MGANDVVPYFKTEPGLPQIHLEGNRLVLTCLAEGSWPLEFKWTHNDSELTTYTSEYKYVIPSLQRLDAGFYRCVVRNRMGALLQRRSEVQVAYMGDFTDADERRVVSEGRAAVLSLPPISSCPRPQVTWFRDGHKIIPSSRIAITLENQLVILAAAASDAGAYYVQAVNERNGENKTSPPVHLSIARDTGMPEAVAPVIVVPPSNRSVVAGSSETTLECIANARPAEELSVTWKRNGVRVTTGLHGFGRRLPISNPTSSDTGVYVCEAALPGSAFEPARARAFLSIIEPPYFTAEPKSRILAEVEENVDIVCEAMGVPPPALQWFKDAISINKLQNPRYQVLAGGGLRIQQLRPEDSGIFQCLASNVGGEVQTHTYLDVTNVAPAFTQLPVDTTVTDGTTAVLRCEVSGAPRPAIVWSRGSHILASGSVRIPRFMLLESGGLQIAPVSIQDAGSYTCHAANSEGSLDASAMLTVWNRTSIVTPPEDLVVIKGTTATLHCGATHDPRISLRYVWKKDNVVIAPSSSSRVVVEKDGSLLISQTWSGDIGDYTCGVISEGGNDSRTARLEVIELPHSPQNLVASLNPAHSHAVVLSWVRPFDGNSPVLYYIVELSENNSPWKVHLSDVGPEMTGVTVRGLTPARTYQFRVCAVNQVGKGQYSAETSRLMLPEEPPSAPPKNIVASGRTNQSIMVQWQPPPEPEHNGVLRGYILRYRLAGLPGEYQQRNISSPEVSYCLVTELIIWTQYEIQVAAYNGAGLGVFSRAVTEYTLQGVPTAPPQNVQVEAVNSTTIQFLWNPPPQQFINGINQGYKLLAWPDDVPEAVTVVTIAPDFHGVHHGYITNLKKFTAYFTSVLCFTTPGDGPPSTPQLIWTHEDKPGAVGHLSFTEILDTSLKVSWQEPLEKNGIITGYQVSWEVYGQSTSRLTLTLNSSTHEYKIQGLSSLTTYTIDVAAVTAAGAGVPTSSTISSGVPPELPGAPSNLVISNISPRSATLQFRPGYDGKTAISRWIVQGQVGAIGDEEEWVTLCEEENEPDAQMLEIPDLTPYTHYRFRMRQANVVGAGPFSQSSRVIQTLQAPPDVAPTSITVRTASETSLRLRWVPLPDSQYNGNPESVGYRIKYWRLDLPSAVLTQVISDRLEREFTVEGLEEWTEYELQMQAFNAIGAGPWSAAVRGRTRESVPSAAPENVSAEAVSSTQILLTWASGPEPDQNGLILGYKILFRAKDLDPEPRSHVVRGNHTQSALLAGLGKFVLYELQVLAFTRIGNGVPSVPPILERTKDDAPGPPVRLVFPEVRLTSVRIVWQPPEEPNGIILGYQIAYRLASSSPNTFTTVEVGATVRQFTATELAPESAYVFRLSAKTRQGWGEPLEATVITTEKRERPAPPRELQVPQADVTARSLCLRWVPGSDGASPIRYFTLQLRELPRGQWQTYSSSISHEATACVVERLRPFTSYKLRLKATNDIGDSDFSAETEAVTTLQDVPGEPPRSVSVTPRTTSSVLIQWQPPRDESLNGLLQGYRIYYRELEYEAAPATESKTLKTPSALRAELTAQSSFKTVNSSSTETTYELTHLKKYRRYEVVLTAYNVIGEGPASAPVEVFVGEAGESCLELGGQQRPPRRRRAHTGGADAAHAVRESRGFGAWRGVVQARRAPPATELRLHMAGWRGPAELTRPLVSLHHSERTSGGAQTDAPQPWAGPLPQPPLALTCFLSVGSLLRGLQKRARAVFDRFTWLPSPGVFPGLTRAAAGVRLAPSRRVDVRPQSVARPSVFTPHRMFWKEDAMLPALLPHTLGRPVAAFRSPGALAPPPDSSEVQPIMEFAGMGVSRLVRPLRAERLTGQFRVQKLEFILQEGMSVANPPGLLWPGQTPHPPGLASAEAHSPPPRSTGVPRPGLIYYWEADSQNDTEKMRVLFLPETTAKLKNLTSHTKYLVSISAFNAAGDGPRSEPQPGCTHQAAPGTPSFLAFSEITSTTLNVSWGEPVAANGVLQGYRVVYEPLAPVQGVSKVVTVDVKGNWPRWLKVRDLTKGVTYFFRVQARTIAYGPELQANVTAGPAEGSPGSPRDVSVTKSTSELTLHWTEGQAGRTPTTGYVIEARPSDEGLWDMFAKDIPRGATAYTVSLDQLRQGVTYEFRVVAVNQAGYGEPSSPSAAVSAQVETPFYEQWWFLLVMALSSLLVILLVVFSLLLHGQSKKYRNCGTGKSISNMEESVTLDNGGFAALELNSRHLNVKNTFSKKNGTRVPARPSPGGLHYSDEDLCNKYNGAALTESGALQEKPGDATESEVGARALLRAAAPPVAPGPCPGLSRVSTHTQARSRQSRDRGRPFPDGEGPCSSLVREATSPISPWSRVDFGFANLLA